jgi:hypothetical protein
MILTCMDTHRFTLPSMTSRLLEWLLTPFLGLIGMMCISSIYFIGQSAQSAYLREFNIDINAFPLEREGYMTTGADVLSLAGTAFIELLRRHWLAILLIVVYILGCNACLCGLRAVHNRQREQLTRSDRHPSNFERFIGTNLVCLGAFVALLFAIPFGSSLMALPGAIGFTIGSHVADSDRKKYSTDCLSPGDHCVVLMKDGAEVDRGFRVVQSKDRIALYRAGKTREYALDGKSLEAFSK